MHRMPHHEDTLAPLLRYCMEAYKLLIKADCYGIPQLAYAFDINATLEQWPFKRWWRRR